MAPHKTMVLHCKTLNLGEKMLSKILQLVPEYRDYLWGGKRLRPGYNPVAEAWTVYDQDKVASGPQAGSALSHLAALHGVGLLGTWAIQRSMSRFPLLIKLLDCAQWLSLQVHPSDELAIQLEGPGFSGKTEAWVILDALPGAQIIAGLHPNVTQQEMQAAIRAGTIQELVQYHWVKEGDTVFMPAGTLHALGPGLLVYEVQQSSDLTYRVYDWDRPQTKERILHLEKALVATNLACKPTTDAPPAIADGGQATLCSSPYFLLDKLSASARSIQQDTAGQSFHALTMIEGSARIIAGDEELLLEQFHSALIPAATGKYQISPEKPYQLLKASIPAP